MQTTKLATSARVNVCFWVKHTQFLRATSLGSETNYVTVEAEKHMAGSESCTGSEHIDGIELLRSQAFTRKCIKRSPEIDVWFNTDKSSRFGWIIIKQDESQLPLAPFAFTNWKRTFSLSPRPLHKKFPNESEMKEKWEEKSELCNTRDSVKWNWKWTWARLVYGCRLEMYH